jgi:hypothetical protein
MLHRTRCARRGNQQSTASLARERSLGKVAASRLRVSLAQPSRPVIGVNNYDLPAVIRVPAPSLALFDGWLPCGSLHRPAIAVIGDPLRANRCLAFGYFLPVNSKKADAGMRQRLLLAKCRPT